MPRRSQAESPQLREALDALRRLAAEAPALAAQAAALAEILPLLASPASLAEATGLTPKSARAKLHEGRPMLRDEHVALDTDELARRWTNIGKALTRHVAAAGAAPRGLDPQRLIEHVLAGRTQAIRDEAASRGLDPQIAATVLRLALFPVFAQLNLAFEPLRKEVPWPHGHCPTCGSWPLLAELRGLQQTRYLRCGLCAADWEFPRLQCPRCATRDHRLLGFLSVEGQESRYRCAACDGCRSYVKTVQSLDRLSGLQLLVYDVATLPLDVAATERGYQTM